MVDCSLTDDDEVLNFVLLGMPRYCLGHRAQNLLVERLREELVQLLDGSFVELDGFDLDIAFIVAEREFFAVLAIPHLLLDENYVVSHKFLGLEVE